MAIFPFIFAAGGAALSAIGAAKSNSANADAGRANLERLDREITNARINRLRETDQLSRNAQRALGATLNVSPEGLSAVETIAARIAAGVASDQFAIDSELERREAALGTAKDDTVRQTNAGMVSPVMAGIGGAMQGFQMGTALDSALANLDSLKAGETANAALDKAAITQAENAALAAEQNARAAGFQLQAASMAAQSQSLTLEFFKSQLANIQSRSQFSPRLTNNLANPFFRIFQ